MHVNPAAPLFDLTANGVLRSQAFARHAPGEGQALLNERIESANVVASGKTGLTSVPAGAIVFGTGSTTLATDVANLFWDDTNNYLRIGGAPTGWATADKLQVNGNALIGTLAFKQSGGFDKIISSANGGMYLQTADGVTFSNDLNFLPGTTSGNGSAAGNFIAAGGDAQGTGSIGGALLFSGGFATDAGGIGGTVYFQGGAGGAGGSAGQVVFSKSNGVTFLFTSDDNGIGFFGVSTVAQQLAATDLGTALANLGLRIAGGYPITATTIRATTNYQSSDGSNGYTGTVTTASLVGKTITIKNGLITAFT